LIFTFICINDSLDWKDLTKEEMLERVLKKTKPGSILLFHNSTKYTSSSLPDIIKALKAKNFELVKVSELIYKDNYIVDPNGVQKQNK